MSRGRRLGDAVKVRTYFDAKPVPSTAFDWSAMAASYEPGDPIGYGATEAEALADLDAQVES